MRRLVFRQPLLVGALSARQRLLGDQHLFGLVRPAGAADHMSIHGAHWFDLVAWAALGLGFASALVIAADIFLLGTVSTWRS